MPQSILDTQPEGMEWIISGEGRALYSFRLVPFNRIRPNENLIAIKIPDATPEIIRTYAISDEQALLAKVRYHRLSDIFLELAVEDGQVKVVEERHYRLVPAGEIEVEDLMRYRNG